MPAKLVNKTTVSAGVESETEKLKRRPQMSRVFLAFLGQPYKICCFKNSMYGTDRVSILQTL